MLNPTNLIETKKLPEMERRLFALYACPQQQFPRQTYRNHIHALSYGQESYHKWLLTICDGCFDTLKSSKMRS